MKEIAIWAKAAIIVVVGFALLLGVTLAGALILLFWILLPLAQLLARYLPDTAAATFASVVLVAMAIFAFGGMIVMVRKELLDGAGKIRRDRFRW